MRFRIAAIASMLAPLYGCPLEDVECEKVMVCEDQTESECFKNECGEDCNFFRTEWCWEECRKDPKIN